MSEGQKWPSPRNAVSHNTPKTMMSEMVTDPAVNQICGAPDCIQSRSFMLSRYRLLYLCRRRWRTNSATVLTAKVNRNSTSAARNNTR